MRLDELYPYWEVAHDELMEMVGLLRKEELDAKLYEKARTIRSIVLDFVYEERYWIADLVAKYGCARPIAAEYPEAADLMELLAATREITVRILEPFSLPGLRAVRTVPADAATNRPETNVSVAWLFWHLLELETMARGQILQRIEDNKLNS